MITNPPEPYNSTEPYIYLSYSHKDSADAGSIIKFLQTTGYRVWCAEDSEPGTDWPENIALRIKRCKLFIVLISSSFSKSRPCNNELYFACSLRKSILSVYLEDFELPPSLKMLLAEFQTILKYKYTDKTAFCKKLQSCIPDEFRCDSVVNAQANTEQPDRDSASMQTKIKPEISLAAENATGIVIVPQESNTPTKKKLPKPYRGTEPYIFISYAHKNSSEVVQVIESLQNCGYHVWYDEGIDPGTEWPDEIAKKILDCSYFMAFLSEESISSRNCKNEMKFAYKHEKMMLLIYLQNVTLELGLSLTLDSTQAIYKHKYSNIIDFYEKLFDLKGLDICLDPSGRKRIEAFRAQLASNYETEIKQTAFKSVVLSGSALNPFPNPTENARASLPPAASEQGKQKVDSASALSSMQSTSVPASMQQGVNDILLSCSPQKTDSAVESVAENPTTDDSIRAIEATLKRLLSVIDIGKNPSQSDVSSSAKKKPSSGEHVSGKGTVSANMKLICVVDTSKHMDGIMFESLNKGLKILSDSIQKEYGSKLAVDILQYDKIPQKKKMTQLPLKQGEYVWANINKALTELGLYHVYGRCAILFIACSPSLDSYQRALQSLKEKEWFKKAEKAGITLGNSSNEVSSMIFDIIGSRRAAHVSNMNYTDLPDTLVQVTGNLINKLANGQN